MQHHPVPTFVLDCDCRVLIWNRACEYLTGVPATEMIGTCNHWQAFFPEPQSCLADVLARGGAAKLATLQTSRTESSEFVLGLRTETWREMPKAGKRLYLAIDAVPIHAEDGQLVAVVETLRDMTEHKLAQMVLQERATLDGLTGIANRRSFDEKLREEWSRARRQQNPLALIMIDVDHFKPYNDIYGHQSGDECLKAVSTILQGHAFRAGDLAARYGGEEFAAILPNTDPAGAHEVAERIRQCIEEANLPHAGSATGARITVSIGVAARVPGPDERAEMLLALADQALYTAKRSGRNRVCIADAGTEPAVPA